MEKSNRKYVFMGVASLLAIIVFLFINPFAWNDATTRTVVTRIDGSQFVRFEPGSYYQGLFAKETVYPNQISVSHLDSIPNLELSDENTVEVGHIGIRFSDATTAKAAGITQFLLPNTEEEMLAIHNAHKSPEALVKRRLAPYTSECLQSSAQLMSSEMHYGGGRAQMTQDYLDQLKNGAFLLKTEEVSVYDSIEKSNKKVYKNTIVNKAGVPQRKFSSIKEYGLTVGDAQITDVDYEKAVDDKLKKIVDAATKSAISKQELMTAQQQAMTAKAQGEKKLIETEYAQKVQQTTEVVQAETKVKLQEQYKLEQKMAADAAIFAAQVVRTDADAEAYKAARLVSAGLSPWDKADFEMRTKIGVATALSKVTLPAYYAPGGAAGNNNILDALLSTKLLDK
jgi:hypothetical protein